MKKLFTILTITALSTAAFAQQNWTDVDVMVKPKPSASLSTSISTTACKDESKTLYFDLCITGHIVTGGNWTFSGGTNIPASLPLLGNSEWVLQDTSAASLNCYQKNYCYRKIISTAKDTSLTLNLNGTTVTDAFNCPSASLSGSALTITVYALPTDPNYPDTTICYNTGYTLPTTAATTTWFACLADRSAGTPTIAATGNLTADAIYYYRVTNGNGCYTDGDITVAVLPKPTATLTASPSVCQFSDSTNFGFTMTITGNPVSCSNWTMTLNGSTYTLPIGGNETWVLTSANAGAPCIPPAQNTYIYFNRITTAFAADSIYTITSLTDCYGCPNSGLNVSATASILNAPTIIITTDDICETGSIPVTITTFANSPAPSAEIVAYNVCADLSCGEGYHPIPSAHTCIAANPVSVAITGGSAGAYTWSGTIIPIGPGTWKYHINSVAQGTCVNTNETQETVGTPTCVSD
jgi:hypothetical protein